jgi:Nucleotidyltransferase of unknown function (DUF6036)
VHARPLVAGGGDTLCLLAEAGRQTTLGRRQGRFNACRCKDLWSLALDHLQVDPDDLAEAIEYQVHLGDLDYRTRLLIHDSLDALQCHWGPERLQRWLLQCPYREQIKAIWTAYYDEVGFPSLRRRIVEITRPEQVRQFLRELAQSVQHPVRLAVGGAIALILPGLLSRRTEDIDVVNEVPSELRSQHQLLATLAVRYGLGLTHFQSHYLPKGWEQRLHSQEAFGHLHVYLVDVYDVFLRKLFSARNKDRDDVRMLASQLDKKTIIRRLRNTCHDLLATPGLREKAEQNWYIIYGESFPA